MSATLDEAVSADPQRTIAELRRQLDEALQREIAAAEVLQIINSSPSDLAPVFSAILEKAHGLCEVTFGTLQLYDGEKLRAVAMRGISERLEKVMREPYAPDPDGPLLGLVNGGRFVQIPDLAERDTQIPNPRSRVAVDLGIRTLLFLPLRKGNLLLGLISAARKEARLFSEREIALLENFAAQAVIAMENARLVTETREALEQQTATTEVLQVINASPGDLAPVFDAMLEKALHLCGANFGLMNTYDGQHFRHAADHGVPTSYARYRRDRGPTVYGAGTTPARLVAGEDLVHTIDLMATEPYEHGDPARRALVDLGGARSHLTAALRKGENLLGDISIYRQEVHPFTAKQVALLQNFAAQAVIAIENARLITETREALEQQTATAEVLQVINSSPGDLTPVFDAILEKAHILCGAAIGSLRIIDGDRVRSVAVRNQSGFFAEELRKGDFASDAPATRALLGGVPFVHIPDVAKLRDPVSRRAVERGGIRTLLAVPLRKEETLLGAIFAGRPEVRPFSDKQIALLQNFAAQAVIAMENVRLITETREALEQQTATAELLQVINSSPGDLGPVFDAMLEKAMRLCDAAFGLMRVADGEQFRTIATRGVPGAYAEFLTRSPLPADQGGIAARNREGEPFVHTIDLKDDDRYRRGDVPTRRAMVDLGGARTSLSMALTRNRDVLGTIHIYRQEVRPFSDKQIALLQNFAAQAVIAIENARLITETREARDDAEQALRELKAAQANLIQAEKMASLGQLTSGIAHEIKNPLNFVNNFANLSVELLDELKEATAPAVATLGEDKRAEVDETMALLTGNLEKIAEHGRRADGIVKSMLEHSRGGTGERREVDLNVLVEEALNLAYHGARARDQNFNVMLERDFGTAIAPIELVPQDVMRVLLNLFGNGFYAATKRRNEGSDPSFLPTLKVTTDGFGAAVEIRVRDNGIGIPPEIKDKLFQPFFTTKPTGEGTGLGLSISWDIVTQGHGGTIEVDSRTGEFTEFAIRLPRIRQAATA